MSRTKALVLSFLLASVLQAKETSVRKEKKEGEALAKAKRPALPEKKTNLNFQSKISCL